MADEEEDNYIEIEEDEEDNGEKQVWLNYLILIFISIGRNEYWLK